MLRRSEVKSGPAAGVQGNRSAALEAIDALYKQEMKANILALRERRRSQRKLKSLLRLAGYWPVAVGVVISLFAPEMQQMVAPFKPWGMWIVFPFVSIAGRPEIFMGDRLAVLVPAVMLYAQFPLEGLIARIALKGNVTVNAVLGQVLFLHALCIIELWLVNGSVWQLLGR
jgi:hypothetical protein